jgi:general secretion pathway protein G
LFRIFYQKVRKLFFRKRGKSAFSLSYLGDKMKKAFTLIELIVVIAIIAILAAIIAPNAFKAIEKAKVARFVGDYKAVKAASYALYGDIGTFPCHYENIEPIMVNGGTRTTGWACTHITTYPIARNIPSWDGPYLEKLPSPPWKVLGNTSYAWQDSVVEAAKNCWNGQTYFYCIEPAFPVTAQQRIDVVVDGGDGPTTGSIRGRVCGANWDTGCFWPAFNAH